MIFFLLAAGFAAFMMFWLICLGIQTLYMNVRDNTSGWAHIFPSVMFLIAWICYGFFGFCVQGMEKYSHKPDGIRKEAPAKDSLIIR